MLLKAVIFDLDGVLVDTSVFHAKAWADLVRSEGHEPPEDLEEQVKGISRMASLKIALGSHADDYSEEELEALAAKKNACYLEAVKTVSPDDLYPGVRQLFDELKAAGVKVALGSASRNAKAVLGGLGIEDDFDVISDGTTHQRGKPHPDVFLGAAWMMGFTPAECIVVEDAKAGIEAALRGGFVAVGKGSPDSLGAAHLVVDSMEALSLDKLEKLYIENRIPEFKGDVALPAVEIAKTDDFEITGDGGASAWDSVEWQSLTATGEHADKAYATRMKMLYSETGLYVLVEGDDAKLSCTLTEDYAALFTEDVIEVFVRPDPWQRTYLEYEVSALGYDMAIRVVNNKGNFHGYQPWFLPPEREVVKKVKVRGGPAESGASIEGWSAELMIPFAVFQPMVDVPPRSGDVWYGNVYRIDIDHGVPAHCAWSTQTGNNFHGYPGFGRLIF